MEKQEKEFGEVLDDSETDFEEEWSEETGQLFNFGEVGSELLGKLIAKGRSKKFDNEVYTIETEDGESQIVFGTTVLVQRMQKVDVGDMVKIRLDDEVDSGYPNKTKIFRVWKKSPVPKKEE